MSAGPIASEVLELLRESREYARYLSELGVETIPHASVNRELLAPGPDPASPIDAAAKLKEGIPFPAQPPLESRAEQATRSRIVPREPTAPPASLFGDLAASPPSLTRSSETLEDIWHDIGDCTRCGLCEGRTQVVNTHGNHKARLMFVGEAPGADEDAQGKPFVGRAGQLLTKIIEAIGLKREEVLIGN